MIINKNEAIFYFDIDQTLISSRRFHKAAGDTSVINPYTNEEIFFKVHYGHVDLLKEMKGRGRYIIVHSAAGVQWALTVIKHLNLEGYVDVVQTKPLGYVDDQPVEKWLSNRIFLEDNERK